MKGSKHTGVRQQGFSMVEVMVAMSISLFLLIGLTQVFVGSKRNYRLHEGIGRIQENGRFAMEILGRQVRMAGYRSTPLDTGSQPVIAVRGENDVAGDDNTFAGSDIIRLEYWGAADGRSTDCLGNTVPPHTRAIMSFRVHPDRKLLCSSSVGDQDNKPLLEGISDMQVLYGQQIVNPATSPPTRAYRYLTADKITNWDNIVSMRIELTADSIESVDPSLPDQGRLQRLYSSTITLRNRL